MTRNIFSKTLKNGVTALVVVVLLISAPLPVAAQTNFQPQTLRELIAYLQGMITVLEAQLQAQQGQQLNVGVGTGIAETLAPQNITRDGAQLRGQINLAQMGSVTVWFEYGRSIVNEFETPRERFNNIRQYTYSYDVTGLRRNATYSYRLVVETDRGQRHYGAVQNFTAGSSRFTTPTTPRSTDNFGLKSTYERGESIIVTIPSRADLTSSAWVSIYQINDSDRDFGNWAYIRSDRQITLRAPQVAGTYQLRLFRDSGFDRVASSNSFTVR